MMAMQTLGKLTLTASGTPQKFTSTPTNCNAVLIQFPFTGNTGPQVYIGQSGIVIATLANVDRILVKRAAATDPFDNWTMQSSVSQGPFDLSTFFWDGDHTGDFILVSFFVA
jgi:hypothetical protein